MEAMCHLSPLPSRVPPPLTILSWRMQSKQLVHRRESHVCRVLVNAKASPGKKIPKEVIMVDPLEAKRLAAKQMEELQAKERLKRRRQIEAINGAWAMIGLTAGLVIEGQTGNNILNQLAGYWSTIVNFFIH